MGLVIGTHGALPYINLHLEARRRFYPHVPMLVHDDGSPASAELNALCQAYGVDFECADPSSGHHHGDLLSFVGGMHWADGNRIDLLVKMSRRFLPLVDWTIGLGRLAEESQYATFSSWTTTWDFGFRTECLALAVEQWMRLGLVDRMVETFVTSTSLSVEHFLHELAQRAAHLNGMAARAFDLRVGQRPPARAGYAVWEFMGFDRAAPNENFLWHDSSGPADYFALASRWGLEWAENDFHLAGA